LAKEYGQHLYIFSFLDCAMGGNSKQSVDSHVARISTLWQKKTGFSHFTISARQPFYYKCPSAILL
jgi:hypothetical protein